MGPTPDGLIRKGPGRPNPGPPVRGDARQQRADPEEQEAQADKHRPDGVDIPSEADPEHENMGGRQKDEDEVAKEPVAVVEIGVVTAAPVDARQAGEEEPDSGRNALGSGLDLPASGSPGIPSPCCRHGGVGDRWTRCRLALGRDTEVD